MVGGAFLNAAITAPKNTRKVLDAFWPQISRSFILGGVLNAIFVIFVHLITGDEGSGIQFLFWLALGHFSAFTLMVFCRNVNDLILKDDDPT